MHGETFEVDLRLLKLGGCDIILGVDYMMGVNLISFDFNKMVVTFEKESRRMTLTGNTETTVCKMILGKKLQKIFKSK